MRVIATIPHPHIQISIFHMNSKYIIKLEAGPMEQAFKVSEEEIRGLENIQKILDEEFIKKALARFNEMFLSFKETKERHGI
jgi:hypothetical protein